MFIISFFLNKIILVSRLGDCDEYRNQKERIDNTRNNCYCAHCDEFCKSPRKHFLRVIDLEK